MPFPIRYCSLCGVPFKAQSVAVPVFWQCEECHALTVGIAAGAWQLGGEPPVQLPLAPFLGRSEVFAHCATCETELAVEISLRSGERACSGCDELGKLLQNAPLQAGATDFAAKPTTLTKLEMAFLGAGSPLPATAES